MDKEPANHVIYLNNEAFRGLLHFLDRLMALSTDAKEIKVVVHLRDLIEKQK